MSVDLVVKRRSNLEPAPTRSSHWIDAGEGSRLQFLSPCPHAKDQSGNESYSVRIGPAPKRAGPGMAVRKFGNPNRQRAGELVVDAPGRGDG